MQTASQRFAHVALLNGRLVAYGAPPEVFTAEHISEAFGGHALFLNDMVVIDECCPEPEARRGGPAHAHPGPDHASGDGGPGSGATP